MKNTKEAKGLMYFTIKSVIISQKGIYLYNLISYFKCPVPPEDHVTEQEKETLGPPLLVLICRRDHFRLVYADCFGEINY